MDISAAMTKHCTDHHLAKSQEPEETEITFEVADAGDPSSMLASWDSHYDLLTTFTAMHWIHDQKAALNSMRYCLKDHGLAVMHIVIQPCKEFMDGKATSSLRP